MRLFEISGDTESQVYSKLRDIYFVLNATSDVQSNSAISQLRNKTLNDLAEDSVNLNYWVLASDRISKLYSEIKKIM